MSDTQLFEMAPSAMPTGNASVIHVEFTPPTAEVAQCLPSRCTGTQTINAYRAAFWQPMEMPVTYSFHDFSTLT